MMAVQLAQHEPCALPQLPVSTAAGKTYIASPLSYTVASNHVTPTLWLHHLEGLVRQRCRETSQSPSHPHAAPDCSQSGVDDSPTQFPDSACLRREAAQPNARRISTNAYARGPHELHSPRPVHLAPLQGQPSQASPSSKHSRGTNGRNPKCRPRNLSGEARHWDSWLPTLEFRRSIPLIRRNAAVQPCGPRGGSLLPPKSPVTDGRCTLVLDLDETLVRAEVGLGMREDTACAFVSGGIVHGVRVSIRPGAAAFLAILAEWFELVMFTASCQDYAEPVLDLLDPDDSIFSHRLFRDSCRRLADGQYIKDLSILGRDLRSTIIVDNTPSVYSLHLDNAIPISSWFSDPTDKALLQLLPLLCHLANVGDVRSPLRRIYRLQDLVFPRPCMALKSTASH